MGKRGYLRPPPPPWKPPPPKPPPWKPPPKLDCPREEKPRTVPPWSKPLNAPERNPGWVCADEGPWKIEFLSPRLLPNASPRLKLPWLKLLRFTIVRLRETYVL